MGLFISAMFFDDLGLSIPMEHPTMSGTLDSCIASMSITKSVSFGISLRLAMMLDYATGEMEGTLLKGAVRNANLSALLSDDEYLRKQVVDLVDTLDVIEKEDVRGFRLTTILDPTVPEFTTKAKLTPGSLDGSHFHLLSASRRADGFSHALNEVLFLEEISHNGVCYGTYSSSHRRNSAVLFHRGPRGQPENQAGVVQNIFEHSCCRPISCLGGKSVTKDYFLILNVYAPINRVGFCDPYPPFGLAAGYLCESQPIETLVIKLSQVVSHFVLTPLEEIDATHVLPVDRVRILLNIDYHGKLTILSMLLQLMLEFVTAV